MFIFLATFVISSLFITNSYLSGRIIKKFFLKLNDSLCFVLGSFGFLAFINLMLIPILLIQINYLFLGYYLLGLQIILFIIYGLNWRMSFLINKLNYSKLFLILTGTIICFAILFAFKNYDLNNLFQLNKNWNDNVFNNAEAKIGSDGLFTYINYTLLMIFNIVETELGLQYIWMFNFAITISSCIYGIYYSKNITNIFSDKKNLFTILSYIIIVMLVTTLSLWITTTPSNGDAWIIVGILLICYLHNISLKTINSIHYVFLINICYVALFFLSPNVTLCLVIISFYFIFANWKHNLNSLFSFNIFLLITLAFIFNMLFFYYISYVNYIIACLVILFYFIYLFISNSKIFNKFNGFKFLNANNVELLYWVIIGTMLATTISLAVATNGIVDWNGWIIQNLMNKTISLNSNRTIYYVVNITWWVSNILIAIFSIINLFIKVKINKNFNKLNLTSFLTIWNPGGAILWNRFILKNNYNSLTNISKISSAFLIDWCAMCLCSDNQKKNIIYTSIIGSLTLLITIGLTIFNFVG